MDVSAPGCNPRRMRAPEPFVLDEIYGARALGALLAGNLEGAEDALKLVSNRYLVGLLVRLGLLMPSVAIRLGYRVVQRRLSRRAPAQRS